MNITLITVGKLKEKYWQQAFQEYSKRLQKYATLRVIEVPDEPTPDNASSAEEELIKKKEADRIILHIKDRDYNIALAIQGHTFTSEDWAHHFHQLTTQGHSSFNFIIGGSLGLHSSVLARVQQTLSFSTFTFPHQMVRVILLEQIYRGFKIIRGEKYHK